MSQHPDLLFGKIALDRGLLSTEQLSALLEEQEKNAPHRVALGELCRRKGILSANQVRRILELQRQGELQDDGKTFGALAVKNDFATQDELARALDAQKDPACPRLGEILIEMGALTEQERKAVLAAQDRLRNGAPREDLEFETREIPVLGGQDTSSPGEPGAWLIQESGEATGQLFHLKEVAHIGRTASHDVAVADMAASRDHATIERTPEGGYVLKDLDSRNGTYVNGAQLIKSRSLRSGDRVRVGDTVFRYVAGAPMTAPKEPTARASRRVLPRIGDLASRVWPGLHLQRKAFAAAALAGAITTLLPWTVAADATWRSGLGGVWGWLALLLFEASFVAVLLRDRGRPMDLKTFAAASAASAAGAAVAFGRLVALAIDPEAGAGIGVPLAVLAGFSAPAAFWFQRRPGSIAPSANLWERLRGTALRAGESTIRIFRDVSGRGGRTAAIDRREALLERIGGAAAQADCGLEDASAAEKAKAAVGAARTRFEAVGKDSSPRDLLIAKSDLAWAESRLRKTLRRLGRTAVDRQLRLESERETIAEVQALDAELEGSRARRGA